MEKSAKVETCSSYGSQSSFIFIIFVICFSILFQTPAQARRCWGGNCFLWQMTVKEDRNNFKYFKVSSKHYKSEEKLFIAEAERMLQFGDMYDGYRLANGRVVRKESTVLLAALSNKSLAYDKMKECDKAVFNREEMKKLSDKKYFVYDLVWNAAYDPDVDLEMYDYQKKRNVIMFGGIFDYSNCFSEEDMKSYPDYFPWVDDGHKDINDVGHQAGQAADMAMAKIDVNNKDEDFFERYLVDSSRAFNLVKSDPDAAVAKALELINFMQQYDG